MNSSLSKSIIVPSRMIFFMWLIYFIELSTNISLSVFGVLPRQKEGLLGVIFAPLLHAGPIHLLSNTLPLLFLGTMVYFFYSSIASKVFTACYIFTEVLVWLLARNTFHIGASGLIYGLASFLFFAGIFNRNFKSIIIAVVVVIFYGGLVFGLLPIQPGVSWESHLFGAIVGGVWAYLYRNSAG